MRAQNFYLALVLASAVLGQPGRAAESGSEPRPVKLTYDQAVQEGLHYNLDLMAARFNIPLAEADELTAGLWNNPSLTIDTVFQPFGSNWNQTNAGGPKQYDLILSYPLDLSGKRSAAAKSAHEASRIAETSLQDAVRQKILQIRLGYIDVMTLQHQLELSREKESDLNRLVNTIENRIGYKQLLPLLQVRAQLARDQAVLDTHQHENALRSAKTALAILLGRAPEEGVLDAVTGLRDFELSPLPEKAAVVSGALSDRPDLKALKLALSKSDLDHSLAQAQVWDNFTVTAGLSSQGPIDAGSVAGPLARELSWNAGVTLPMPFFNRNQGNVQKSLLNGQQAEKQANSLQLTISQEIGDIYNQLQTLRGLIGAYESKQLKSARQVRDSQQKLFGTGSNALLDYFDAVSAYVGTLSAYYDTVGDYRRAVAKLNASAGKDVIQ